MSSSIITTNPVQGSPTTASVRDNFTAAATEINELQKMSEEFKRTDPSGDGAAYIVTFDDGLTLADGVRVTVEIHTISTATTPTLNANSTGAKTIVKAGSAGGSALVAGDLKEDALIELMYVASGGDGITDKWVWLNCVSESANLTSPSITAATVAAGALSGNFSGNPSFTGDPNFTGSPTAVTQSLTDSSTKLSTTAFVQGNLLSVVAGQFRLNADITIGSTSPVNVGSGGAAGSFVEADDSSYSRSGS